MEKELMTETEEKIQALAQHLGLDDEDKENIMENADCFSYYNEEYEVLTDEEADDRWEEELNNYIDECVYPEIPEYLRNYFNEERWKDDARIDGRGHAISRYDGEENYEEVNGTTYYIYRQN